jgi:hypothetical protein
LFIDTLATLFQYDVSEQLRISVQRKLIRDNASGGTERFQFVTVFMEGDVSQRTEGDGPRGQDHDKVGNACGPVMVSFHVRASRKA